MAQRKITAIKGSFTSGIERKALTDSQFNTRREYFELKGEEAREKKRRESDGAIKDAIIKKMNEIREDETLSSEEKIKEIKKLSTYEDYKERKILNESMKKAGINESEIGEQLKHKIIDRHVDSLGLSAEESASLKKHLKERL